MLHLSVGITLMLAILAAALGAVLGSFLNCAAWRFAHNESVLHGRSHCALCGHTLSARDLIPIVSWVALRGRCRYCGKPVSKRYVLAELVGAAMAVSLLLRYDISFGLALYAFLLFPFFCSALIDYETGLLPDAVTLALAIGFFPLGYLYGGTSMLLQGLIGAAALFFPIWGVSVVMKKRTGKDAMGWGDLQLFAVLGLYFGWKQGILMVLLACIFGILDAKVLLGRGNHDEFYFAPAMFAAAWLTALIGEPVITWYVSLF